MKHFIVTLRHDRGIIRIPTTALNAEKTGELVITSETCPRQATISVVEVIKKKTRNNINFRDYGGKTIRNRPIQPGKRVNCSASGIEELLRTIDEALVGRTPMSLNIASTVVRSFKLSSDSPLSEFETHILQEKAQGKSYTKIATELFINKEIVRSHIRKIYQNWQ